MAKTKKIKQITKTALMTALGIISSILIGFGAVDLFRQKDVSPTFMIVSGLILLSIGLFINSNKR